MTRENLSQFVSRIVRQNKLNLHDVERKSGGKITNSYISKIMRGTVTNLSVDKIIALAAGLEVNPFEIFASMCEQSPPAESQQPMDARVVVDILQKIVMNPRLVEILYLCEPLPDRDQLALIAQLRYLREKSKPRPKPKSRRKEKH